MNKQEALTLITPIVPDQHKELHTELRKIKHELFDNIKESFEELGTIHFARWIILEPAEVNGEKFSARLVFSSNYDSSHIHHITALCMSAAEFLDRIYQYCEGYPSGVSRTTESRKIYLEKWQVGNVGFYVGAPGRTVDQIRKESSLQKFVRVFLNSKDWTGKTSAEIHRTVRDTVLSHKDFSWINERISIPGVNYWGLISTGLVVLILLPFILIWLLIIEFFHERHDVPLGLTPSQVSEPHIRRLEEYEDFEYQNQFTQVLIMKAGPARLMTFKGFMLFSRKLIGNLFVKGKLMGIPTIHFARWLLMDDNKRMLFLSNFDGSWQQYLGDFIDKSGWGLTAIWSNSMGFPRTRFSYFGGAYDEEHFLAWSRYYEIPTQVWYSAYPQLSIKNIVNNTKIRMELMQDLTEKQAAIFLKRI